MEFMKELLATKVAAPQITEGKDDMDFSDMLDKYRDEEKLHRTEGRAGVTALAQICAAIGYKDPQHFGQLSRDAAIGDLVNFLEDNSGAIDGIIEFIIAEGAHSENWKDNLQTVMEENGYLGDEDEE